MKDITNLSNEVQNVIKNPVELYENALIHSLSGNSLTLYNPSTKTKTTVVLNNSIDGQADSILCNNRIFIMGGAHQMYLK